MCCKEDTDTLDNRQLMSSSLSSLSTTEQNEQQISTTPTTNEPSVSSQQLIDHSITSSQAIPLLAGQILTQNDHENNLMDDIDGIICDFLNRYCNRQHSYETVLRWTRNDIHNLKYNVVVSINRSEDL
jgi:hypothetical protein